MAKRSSSRFLRRNPECSLIAPAVSHKAGCVLIPWRQASSSVPAPGLQATRASAAADGTRVQAKIVSLFVLAAEIFLNLEELGLQDLDWRDQQAVAQAGAAVMVAARRLSLPRLNMVSASLRRWRRFAETKGWSPASASAIAFAAFLDNVGRGGPTAASAVYQALVWLNQNLAAGFPLNHFMVKPFRFRVRQAPELHSALGIL